MRGALVVLAALLLAGCAEEGAVPSGASAVCDPALPTPDPAWAPRKERARIGTDLGAFVVELESERAPVTSANFLSLARNGTYDGTLFHRVVRGFVVQAGDPLSKDDDPSNDGTGGPGYEIPDEFHPDLRHDAPGVLSMANSGPNTGGSQFFVTLGATPHLDDRHSVFGRVVEGMDVVSRIGAVLVDDDDRPVEPVRIETVEVLEPASFEPVRAAGIHVVVEEKRSEPGRSTRFAVVAKNEGNVRDALALGASPPAGWTCALDGAPVAAGTARVLFLTLVPPAGAKGPVEVPVYVVSASGERANATVTVDVGELGAAVRVGDKVTANYAGLLPDGRLFDTSMERVARDEDQPKFVTNGGFRDRGSYSPFPFTVGSGVIAGFTELAKTAKVGETVTGPIPAKDAYAQGNMYERPLTGRDLVFELEILRVG